MANNLSFCELVARETFMTFMTTATFPLTCNRMYESEYRQKYYLPGDNIDIRLQNRFETQTGTVVTTTDIEEQLRRITLQPIDSVCIELNGREISTKLPFSQFSERLIKPAAQSLAATVNAKIGNLAKTSVNHFVGAAGTPINTFATVNQARAKLGKMGCLGTMEKSLALSLDDGVALSNSLQNTYNQKTNSDVTLNGYIRNLSEFKVYEEQSIPVHTNGTDPGATTVNGAVSSGNTIVLSTTTASGTLTAGTLISIAGVKQVNPQTRASWTDDMQFVITANATISGSAVTITVSPEIIVSGPNQNVSNAIPNGEAVTFIDSHNVNLAYGTKGLLFASVKLPPLPKVEYGVYSDTAKERGGFGTGLSLCVYREGSAKELSDTLRISILWGALWMPEQTVVVLS